MPSVAKSWIDTSKSPGSAPDIVAQISFLSRNLAHFAFIWTTRKPKKSFWVFRRQIKNDLLVNNSYFPSNLLMQLIYFYSAVCKKGYYYNKNAKGEKCIMCANLGEYKETVSDDAECKKCNATYGTGSTTVSKDVANTALSACGNF